MKTADNYDLQTAEEAEKEAKLLGVNIVFPSAHELQLDIDSEESLERSKERINWMRSYLKLGYDVRKSKSPGHYHITITLSRAVTDWERVALQAVLGSDPDREMISACSLLAGLDRPTRFFETKSSESP